eukprot:g5678.t1
MHAKSALGKMSTAQRPPAWLMGPAGSQGADQDDNDRPKPKTAFERELGYSAPSRPSTEPTWMDPNNDGDGVGTALEGLSINSGEETQSEPLLGSVAGSGGQYTDGRGDFGDGDGVGMVQRAGEACVQSLVAAWLLLGALAAGALFVIACLSTCDNEGVGGGGLAGLRVYRFPFLFASTAMYVCLVSDFRRRKGRRFKWRRAWLVLVALLAGAGLALVVADSAAVRQMSWDRCIELGGSPACCLRYGSGSGEDAAAADWSADAPPVTVVAGGDGALFGSWGVTFYILLRSRRGK